MCPARNAHAPHSNGGLPGPTIFFHILIKGAILGREKKKLLNIKCVLWCSLQPLSEIFLILRRIQRDITIMSVGLHVKYMLFLSDFNDTWNFLHGFSKNTQIRNFMKIRAVAAELFHAYKRADWRRNRHDEASSRSSQFCGAPETWTQIRDIVYGDISKPHLHITFFLTLTVTKISTSDATCRKYTVVKII